MVKFQIFATDEFLAKLEKINSRDKRLITKKLETFIVPQLKEQPVLGLNIKKLKNYDSETWRYRVGDFRIFYSVNKEEKIINLLTIENRKSAYKKK